jgi:hypothetical protein
MEASLDEALDDGAARNLDRDGDPFRLALTEPCELVHEARDRGAVVVDLALGDDLA